MTGPAGAGPLVQSQATQKQIKIKIIKTVRPNDTAPRSPGNDCSLSLSSSKCPRAVARFSPALPEVVTFLICYHRVNDGGEIQGRITPPPRPTPPRPAPPPTPTPRGPEITA